MCRPKLNYVYIFYIFFLSLSLFLLPMSFKKSQLHIIFKRPFIQSKMGKMGKMLFCTRQLLWNDNYINKIHIKIVGLIEFRKVQNPSAISER